MAKQSYYDFILNTHPNFRKYYDDWQLASRSFYGGVEFRDGNYLKAYDNDYTTPSEVINTYDVDDYGNQTNRYRSSVTRVNYNMQVTFIKKRYKTFLCFHILDYMFPNTMQYCLDHHQ